MSDPKQNNDSLLRLYLTFFKMGLVTFGGGYAMLPILEREVVEKYRWADKEKVLDYYWKNEKKERMEESMRSFYRKMKKAILLFIEC